MESCFEFNDNVKCGNLSLLKTKLSKVIEAGCDNVQIVADFDYTLTSFHPSGTCFSVIRTYPGFSKEFLAKTGAIKDKHYPIHIDHTLPEAVRTENDATWFREVVRCFVGEKFYSHQISDMLEQSSCRLRAGVPAFLALAHHHRIPVLIVSGGISDVIEMLLRREQCYYDNITILSNKLRYDGEGMMVGAEEPFMTASSKLQVILDHAYFRRVERAYLLLLGDMLSDLKVSQCVRHEESVSVGFCHNPDTDLHSYCHSYDVVLLGNPDFAVVNRILAGIVGTGATQL